MKYYLDCEFDGHNGPLLSMALVREDGHSIHIETTAVAADPWVVANVVPLMDKNEATTHPLAHPLQVGVLVREFMAHDDYPVVIADSPVDIGRFCQAVMTSKTGEYAPNFWSRLSFEVHDVDCYPTTLAGAVQHNAWWDAMALRDKLGGTAPAENDAIIEAAARAMCDRVNGIGDYDENIQQRRPGWTAQAKAALDAAAIVRATGAGA